MKPFILCLAETVKTRPPHSHLIQYSETLNLNTVKGTQIPAIRHRSNEASRAITFTKTEHETQDNELSTIIAAAMDTATKTDTGEEIGDSDYMHACIPYLDTHTFTEDTGEATDSDY